MLEEKYISTHDSDHQGVPSPYLSQRIHSRSEAAQEIISRQPGFFEKWALVMFMAILLLLVAGTWFIRYPDIVQAGGHLTAENAPKEIVARQTGRLSRLLVKNGEQVHRGDIIGWLESTANTHEVLDLSKKLDSSLSLLESGNSQNIPSIFYSSFSQLGELQIPYQTFSAALQQYNDYLVNGFYMHKKQMLLQDIGTLQQMNASIEKQKRLTSEDTDSSQRTLAMNKILLDEKVISPEEYRAAKSKHISRQMAIPQLNASILSNQSQQRDKIKEIEQLEHDVRQQKTIFTQALQTLKSSVDEWLRQYVMVSPMDGSVVFTQPLQQNKFIEQGKLLAFVNPPDNRYYLEINLPQNNMGKVDTGMQVQLRFDAYPFQEVGFVKGRVSYISPIASDSGFLATVRLTHGLETNLKMPIQYKNGLKIQALIITKDMRLLQRIYYSIVKSMSPGK